MKFVEYNPIKLDCRMHGPYPIVRVFTNGTVWVQLASHIQETVNIRKLLLRFYFRLVNSLVVNVVLNNL